MRMRACGVWGPYICANTKLPCIAEQAYLPEADIGPVLNMANRTLQGLGRMARQTLIQTEQEQGSTAQMLTKRFFYPDRYSPRQFAKDKPLDPSALWWHKSAFVEAWYWRRDHLEREFSWNTRNTFELSYFIGGITALFYALSVFGVRSADRQSGYPKRNILWHPTDNTFVCPDEREFY